MRLFAIMPTKNEHHRYLEPVLLHLRSFVDKIFVYDDRSIDDTLQLAHDLGCIIRNRLGGQPAFLTHEGQFRQLMWDKFVQSCAPEPGDWVLANDADEFLVGDLVTSLAFLPEASGIRIPFKEIFGSSRGRPLVRVDGQWSKISGVRLFPYQAGATWPDRKMGCGSCPTYAMANVVDAHNLTMLHYGYARKEDRAAKYQRYRGLLGHSSDHIESILTTPTLVPLEEATYGQSRHHFARRPAGSRSTVVDPLRAFDG